MLCLVQGTSLNGSLIQPGYAWPRHWDAVEGNQPIQLMTLQFAAAGLERGG